MPTYLLAYHGVSLPKSEAEQTELAHAWKAWMDGLNGALEGSNNPINIARTINPDGAVGTGGGANPVMGLSFVTADNIDAAVEIAQSCPHWAPAAPSRWLKSFPALAVRDLGTRPYSDQISDLAANPRPSVCV